MYAIHPHLVTGELAVIYESLTPNLWISQPIRKLKKPGLFSNINIKINANYHVGLIHKRKTSNADLYFAYIRRYIII